MNLDMLSRIADILQRTGGMEQISQLLMIVWGAVCIFGLLNCILGYRILRFWMMIFGFLIGAAAGFGVTYMSGVQDKMMIVGAMAGGGIVLAIVSFLVYRAGIFVLGFGIGISLSIYLVHPTSSFSFFLCILIGVGLGALAMRYAKGVIIIGTSILGGVLAGLSIAQMSGLAQFPYGVGMAVGIAALGMLIQFAINRERYEDEEDEDDDQEPEQNTKRPGNREPVTRRREAASGRGRDDDREERDPDRRSRGESRRRENTGKGTRNERGRNNSSDHRRTRSSERSYSSGRGSDRRRSQSRSASGRRNSGDSRYVQKDDYDRYAAYQEPEQEDSGNTYEDFEKRQRRKRQMDIENMADCYEETEGTEALQPDRKSVKDMNLDPEDYDEWKDN